jgi:hypothetical protein
LCNRAYPILQVKLYLKVGNRTTLISYTMTTNDAGVRNQAKQTEAPAKFIDRRSYQLKDGKSASTASTTST